MPSRAFKLSQRLVLQLRIALMITFRVAREQFGWAVQMDQRMTTPFRTRDLAVREAEALAGSLRAHGQPAEVVIQGDELVAPPMRASGAASALPQLSW